MPTCLTSQGTSYITDFTISKYEHYADPESASKRYTDAIKAKAAEDTKGKQNYTRESMLFASRCNSEEEIRNHERSESLQ